MVFLALSRQGFEETLPVAETAHCAIWLAGGVLSDSELKTLRSVGRSITNLSMTVDVADLPAIETIVETIRQHHPFESIWVERGVGSRR